MRLLSARFFSLAALFLLVFVSIAKGAAEPKVQILSPKEGSSITQEQNSILISGKVASQAARSENVDIMFIIDISGSCPTVRARVDLVRRRSLFAALG